MKTLKEVQDFLGRVMTIHLSISGEVETLLKDLSALSGNDLSKTLKKALATEAFFTKHVKVGYKILMQAPDGELREVILK